MSKPYRKDQIIGFECRHAVHMPALEPGGTDLHFVKEAVHIRNDDGTTSIVPNKRFIKDYKRPYYVTKKGRQNHKDKKEWEKVDSLDRFECTQSELTDRIAQTLQDYKSRGQLKKLALSPYLYGADILSTACIKRAYQDKYPDLISKSSVAAFDTETDVLHGTGEIIIASLTFKDKAIVAVKRSFLQGMADVEATFDRLSRKYLGEVYDERNIKMEFVIVENEIDIIRRVFERAHQWQPDFITIWNIEFDMGKILAACKRAGVDPKDIFSDPSIPKHARFFNYVPGPKKKKTASGKETAIPPPMQWHTAFCPASFYFVDGMCSYKQIRMGEAEEPNYKLDTMLDKHLKKRKLSFEAQGNLSGIDLHIFMQSTHPIEYIIYNCWDSISMECLDEATQDLALTLGMFSGCSDYTSFRSQPRRRVDDLHFFCLQNGYVIATTSSDMKHEFDDMTLGLEGWIITLPAHLVMDNGLRVIKEIPSLRTNIRAHVGDLDVSASYPNGGAVFNISKATTLREIHKIVNVEEEVAKMAGINLSGGASNAVEFCTTMFALPTLQELTLEFKQEIGYVEPLLIEEYRHAA